MKRAIIITIAGLAVIATWLITACSSDEEAESQADFKHDKADLMGKLRAAIDSVDLRLSELEAEATTATGDMSGEMKAKADSLRSGIVQQLERRKNDLSSMMDEVSTASQETFDSLQTDIRTLVQETHDMLNSEDTAATVESQRSG